MSSVIINPYQVQAAGGGGDPYWANVVSLLHLNGTNGSTTFTDETGRSWTGAGNAQISTAQSKFGGASLELDGSGDFIQTADSADFAFGSGDWTIEAQVRRGAVGTQIIMGQWGAATGDRSWLLFIDGGNSLNFAGFTTGGFTQTDGQLTNTSQFYHVMACRSGSLLYLGIDGIVNSGAISDALQDSPAAVQIGSYDSGTAPLTGFIDEVRITKGVARYTANFTPPTAEFPNFT